MPYRLTIDINATYGNPKSQEHNVLGYVLNTKIMSCVYWDPYFSWSSTVVLIVAPVLFIVALVDEVLKSNYSIVVLIVILVVFVY